MKGSEYVGTIIVKDIVVNIGIDDYGQCYFIEWIEEEDNKSVVRQIGLGAYCTDFLESACSIFDYKGVSISLYGKELWDKETELIKKRYESSGWAAENPEAFMEWLSNRNRTDYDTYDFDKMYKEFRKQGLFLLCVRRCHKIGS